MDAILATPKPPRVAASAGTSTAATAHFPANAAEDGLLTMASFACSRWP